MSRSYKKTPLFCDRNPRMKKYANRRFRRYNGEVQNGKWYKKYTCSYNICDYKFGCWSKKEVLKEVIELNIIPLYKYYIK